MTELEARRLRKLRKDCRDRKRELEQIVKDIEAFLQALDAEMKRPSSPERGRRVAALSNALEMRKDVIRFGVLDIDFRTGKKRVEIRALKEPR